jgi:hypothetical protein
VLGGLDALRRFLLERMDDPDVIANLHGVNHAIGVTPECQGNLEYAGAETLQGFRYIGFTTLLPR